MASLTQWTWVWVDSRSWWWTGRPGVLWFMGSQRVRHDWATELNWTPLLFPTLGPALYLHPFHTSTGGSFYRPLLSWTSLAQTVAQTVKNRPAMQETQVQSLGREDPLEKGMATHCSILAWRIPWTEESGGLQSMGSQRVSHDWATNPHSYHMMKINSLRYRTECSICRDCW